MIKLTLILALIFLTSCASKYDYSVHKPKVKYKPSVKAIKKLNRQTLGHRYLWGAENNGKYDCSGLTYYTLGSMGIDIPRVAREQFKKGTPISKSELQKGDLVFFATSRRRPGVATHVGIYLGNGRFQHASSSKRRVVISSLNKAYYKNHYLGARRYYNFNNSCKPKQNQYIAYSQTEVKDTQMNRVYQPKPYVAYSKQVVQSNQLSNQNPFIEADSSSYKSSTSNITNYTLIVPSSNPNILITKLKLSGFNPTLDANGNVIVGQFRSKAKAIYIKNSNYELLQNATIRGYNENITSS